MGCTSCFEDDILDTRRASMSSRSLNHGERGSRTGSTSSESGPLGRASAPAIETPPDSPRVAALQGAQGHRRDSSFRRTYDENDKKRAIPCENCALTLPRKTKEGANLDRLDNNGPILRTRKPYKRISVQNPSPPKSASSDSSTSSSDSENAISSKLSHRRAHSRTLTRGGTSSSNSSFHSTNSHDHYLDYTSTHEPLSPASFSIIRQSCLRTLSCETLPPSYTQFTSSPTCPYLNTPFSAGPSTSTSGGPIFFGDPLAGYTTAYIFRIPDPNARGRRRVYALMALSTHRERVAMQTFSYLSSAFRDLAAWILSLAEAELDRSLDSPRSETGRDEGSRHSTPTSSFLSGRSRIDGGFKGMSLRARGLAEIVGLPDFFLELHARFVRLLVELRAVLGA